VRNRFRLGPELARDDEEEAWETGRGLRAETLGRVVCERDWIVLARDDRLGWHLDRRAEKRWAPDRRHGEVAIRVAMAVVVVVGIEVWKEKDVEVWGSSVMSLMHGRGPTRT
jgi:hypothetical protein